MLRGVQSDRPPGLRLRAVAVAGHVIAAAVAVDVAQPDLPTDRRPRDVRGA
jgi:hypothetical protein